MSEDLKIKICGLMNEENIRRIARLKPDFMGFIFYKKSPRYAADLSVSVLNSIHTSVNKTAVFVNDNTETIKDIVSYYQFNSIQLHGNESPVFCDRIKRENPKTTVIKALQIESRKDLNKCLEYQDVCDFFLFDNKTVQYGGSGKKFDWNILKEYKLLKPFFLSGGISFHDINEIISLRTSGLPVYAVDLNSRIEISPGIKNLDEVKKVLNDTRKNSQLK